MFDRRIAAFDIETIPDPDLGRRLLGIEGDDAAVVREMARRRLEETTGKTDYPQLPWHRVVSVCVSTFDPDTRAIEIRSLGGEPSDERSHVEGFFRFVAAGTGEPMRLVSWNGGGFDLPVLRYRAMVLGVSAPELYRGDEEEGRKNSYQARYHGLHVDLMDVLSGHGASPRVGLGAMGQVLGLPGKTFLERPVYEHVLEGESTRVTEYCKLDTLQTLLVYLAWSHHTGHLSRDELLQCADAARVAVRALTYPAWRDVEAMLERWPAWA
jgi:predicted PolB exonuclease-like 3'-5' exonuclease